MSWKLDILLHPEVFFWDQNMDEHFLEALPSALGAALGNPISLLALEERRDVLFGQSKLQNFSCRTGTKLILVCHRRTKGWEWIEYPILHMISMASPIQDAVPWPSLSGA